MPSGGAKKQKVEMHAKRIADPTCKRPRCSNREMDKLIRICWDLGCWCTRGGNNHIKVYDPWGNGVVSVPSTPSGSRTPENVRTRLKSNGLSVDQD